jgi:hypothetical protein
VDEIGHNVMAEERRELALLSNTRGSQDCILFLFIVTHLSYVGNEDDSIARIEFDNMR